MLALLRTAVGLIEPGKRAMWILLVLLSVVVSAFEATGALLIFGLLALLSSPEGSLDLPLVGSLREAFPSLSTDALLLVAASLTAGFFLLRAVAVMGQIYAQNRAVQATGVWLSGQLFRGYLRSPYAVHVNRNSSELVRNSFETVGQVLGFVLSPGLMFFSELLITLGILSVLVLTAPLATLVFAGLFAPLVLVVLRVLRPRLERHGQRNQAAIARSYQWLQQGLNGLREVRLRGREEFFERRFDENRREVATTQFTRSVLVEVPRVLIETFLILPVVALLALSMLQGRSVEATLPLLGLFGYGAIRAVPSLNRMLTYVNNMRFGAPAAAIVRDELARAAARTSAGAARTDATVQDGTGFTDELRLEGVSYKYDGSDDFALRDVSLRLQRGEAIGIVGPTGGGKSTMVDLLTGLLSPTSGIVTVDGEPLEGRALERWQRQVGVVPQQIFLLDDTLRRNIAFGLEDDLIDEGRIQAAVVTAQLEKVVAELPAGLDTVLGENGVRLSGGERQRVAIARALYDSPAVLFFDEGTSALDTVTEAELVQALRMVRGGRTIITVAHRLSTVRECDRIVLLQDGRVVDIGTHDELLERSQDFREMVAR